MFIAVVILLLLILSGIAFMRQASFGQKPTGERMQRMQEASNFRDGAFQNIHDTPSLTEGATYTKVMKEFFLTPGKRKKPGSPIPSVKVDLHRLSNEEDILVWFGHSSYFIQWQGNRFLVDPVFSGHASPVSFTTNSFEGSDRYTVEDLPDIDYLVITHDHWDHLDYKTVTALLPRVEQIITSLGVGAHLERWGYDPAKIRELNWNESIDVAPGISFQCMPARHFSGRGFKRNGTLWSSFILAVNDERIYLGGDSGYDDHFKQIGDQFGPFKLAILENGQYDLSWKYIHMLPEQVVQAAIDLQAGYLLPVHWAKFPLGNHAWDEPILRITKAAQQHQVALVHPRIGAIVNLNNPTGANESWWQDVE